MEDPHKSLVKRLAIVGGFGSVTLFHFWRQRERQRQHRTCPAPNDLSSLSLVLVQRGSAHQCIFSNIAALREGIPAPLVLTAPCPGVALTLKTRVQSTTQSGNWRFIVSAFGNMSDAVRAQ